MAVRNLLDQRRSRRGGVCLALLWIAVLLIGWGGPASGLFPAAAWAAPEASASSVGGPNEGSFVLALLLLLVVGRGLGEVFQRFGQPAVMGQLVGGILLGPTVFGFFWPSLQAAVFSTDPSHKSMLDAVSQLGILLLLLLTGMETDLRMVRRTGAACFSISATGLVIPFVFGFALAQFLPDALLPEPGRRVVAGLFLGTALSVSSVKIVATIVREMNFMRRRLGQVIISSAIIEDTIGWLIIAVTFGVASARSFEVGPLLLTVFEVAVFMAVSLTIGRTIVFTLIRWTNDAFRSEYAVVTMIIVIMGVMALITDAIGVHTMLGAFIAGVLVGESPILTKQIEASLRGLITALFMPVFFGTAGLSSDLTVLADPHILVLTAILVLIASLGKFLGAGIGSKAARMSWREAVAVGCAMNARGSTEVIVAAIGLSMNILSHTLFTMIVTTAIVTTLAMPPMLRWALLRVPLDEEEKALIERETIDERGFVAGLERLLVVVDRSPAGRFAAFLSGVIGGSRGMPTTVLQLDPAGTPAKAEGEADEEHLDEVKKGAKESADAVKRSEDTDVDRVHLTSRSQLRVTAETISEEARKGYSLLMVGIEKPLSPAGGFRRAIEEMASGFEGPLCLLAGSSRSFPELARSATILVPVNGTDVSRHAVDFALALARPRGARVRVLYVSRNPRERAASFFRRREQSVLRDLMELAERYGVRIESAIRASGRAQDEIVAEAGRGISMVVMGVTQHLGEGLFFGDTAAAVLSSCPVPLVLTASQRGRSPRD